MAEWRQALAELSLDCAGAQAAESGALLDRLVELLAQAPAGSGAGLPADWCRARYLQWRASAADETAVLALIGDRAGYMLSRGPEGPALATIVLPERAGEHSASGENFALALLEAFSAALAEGADGDTEIWPSRPH